MTRVEPVVGEPAAVADLGDERALLVADIHAGIEAGLRYERGVELDDRADDRRSRLCGLIDETDADRLVVLGDLAHRVGAPEGEERDELAALVAALTDRVSVTLVEGNHDAGVAEAFADDIDVIGTGGGTLGGDGGVGVVHGHTWPEPSVGTADVVCMGHEHPQVRLEDAVGGSRTERAWLRGPVWPRVFVDGGDAAGAPGATEPVETETADGEDPPELVVFPAFNERSGGTWVNAEGASFLAPFLPDGLAAADAYLLDGTRLGDFRRI